MATTTEKRDRQVVKIADAAMMVDINTGEVLAEQTRQHLTSPTSPASPAAPAPSPAKKAAEKLPYNAVVVDGATCPECGGKVAHARMNGSRFEVCMRQFSEEPECWYAKELPKDGDKSGAADANSDTHADDGTTGERFEDGGADLGGAQMKTASKTEDGADGGKAPTKKGKGKK